MSVRLSINPSVCLSVCVQTAAKPKCPKEKHPVPHKKRSPAPIRSRSLLHNLSSNTSKCSLTADKDPYAFDSEDEVPDLPAEKPAANRGKTKPGRKWHEEEEEQLPRVREKKRVYSNKVCSTGEKDLTHAWTILHSLIAPLWLFLFYASLAGKVPALI